MHQKHIKIIPAAMKMHPAEEASFFDKDPTAVKSMVPLTLRGGHVQAQQGQSCWKVCITTGSRKARVQAMCRDRRSEYGDRR